MHKIYDYDIFQEVAHNEEERRAAFCRYANARAVPFTRPVPLWTWGVRIVPREELRDRAQNADPVTKLTLTDAAKTMAIEFFRRTKTWPETVAIVNATGASAAVAKEGRQRAKRELAAA